MDLKKIVDEYEMILVGLGEAFEEKTDSLESDTELSGLALDYKRKLYFDNNTGSIDEAYEKLSKILENKNYFIVTLSRDDKIYKSPLQKNRIVAPCGTHNALQCEEVCTKDIYSLDDYSEKILKGEDICCPHCGKPLVMNKIGNGKYSEEGYLSQWQLYTKWLQHTLNKKLLIIELGVEMKYPSVIRWPFEKTCYINAKAKFFRVNDYLYHMTEEIKERGIGIKEDPVEFLRNQIV